jgi:hypothetical protein
LSLACPPNGEYLAVVSAREGATLFSLKQPPVTASKETCKDADEAWTKLDSPDYDTRSVAVRFFVKGMPAREATADLLKRAGHLHTSEDTRSIGELIGRLDADNYSIRVRAFDDLRAIGGAARRELADAAAKNPSPEVRARTAELLSAVGGPYNARSVLIPEILRMLDTPEARSALHAMGSNAAGAIGAK